MGNICTRCGTFDSTIYNHCINHLTDLDRINSIGTNDSKKTELLGFKDAKAFRSLGKLRLLRGQTYDQFVNLYTENPRSKIRVIFLLPLRNESDYIDDILFDYCSSFFQHPIVLLRPYDVIKVIKEIQKDTERDYGYKSLDLECNIDQLKDSIKKYLLPQSILIGISKTISFFKIEKIDEIVGVVENDDNLCVIKNTEKNIFPDERIGIVQENLFFSDKSPLYIERLCKIVTRIICRILGMEHCVFWECLMNDEQSYLDSLFGNDEYNTTHCFNIDTYPMKLCPTCLNKLDYLFKLDLKRRRRILTGFAKRNNLPLFSII